MGLSASEPLRSVAAVRRGLRTVRAEPRRVKLGLFRIQVARSIEVNTLVRSNFCQKGNWLRSVTFPVRRSSSRLSLPRNAHLGRNERRTGRSVRQHSLQRAFKHGCSCVACLGARSALCMFSSVSARSSTRVSSPIGRDPIPYIIPFARLEVAAILPVWRFFLKKLLAISCHPAGPHRGRQIGLRRETF